MLELGIIGLWLLATYEVYSRYSFLTTCLFIVITYIAANYGPLLFGYESVKGNDAIWMIEAPTNRMIITSVGIYDKTTPERVRKALDGRIFYGKKRSRQYFTYVLGKPFWVEDKSFTFDKHFHVVTEHIKTNKDLCLFASKVAASPFPDRYSPWCFYVIENYLENNSAVITKFHHAFLDGISAVSATVHCSDPECGRDFFKMPKMSMFEQTAYNFLALLTLPYLTLSRLWFKEDRNPLHGTQLSGEKSIHWTKPYLLLDYKIDCKKKGITLNDFLAAACLRTLKRYIKQEYGENSNEFTIFMPFSLRGQPEDGSPLPVDNDFAAILIQMPRADSPSLETECARVFHRLKMSIEPLTCHLAINIMGMLPKTVAKWMLFKLANKATLLFSNVPGPRSHLTFNKSKLQHLMSMSPMEATCGVAMTVISYAEEFTISCYADKALVKDSEELVRILQEEIESARFQTSS